MPKLTIVQAVAEALAVALAQDDRVLLLGEDIGQNGGVFRATEGLSARFGDERVVDTPLAESAIVGTAIGLALAGLRPVAEVQFMGFLFPALDQLISHAARYRARTQGRFSVPLVVRAPYGGLIRGPELHSESLEALLAHIPGLKVVVPSTPYDAKGLLLSAIADPDPVIFMEPMRSYRAFREEVPEGWYTVPLGQARVAREGEHITLLAWGNMLHVAMETATQLDDLGIKAEVIDLRTLAPLDLETITASVRKTGRAVVVHEAPRPGGLGAEVAAAIGEACLLWLEAPVARVAGYATPYPFFALEDHYVPDANRVLEAVQRTLRF